MLRALLILAAIAALVLLARAWLKQPAPSRLKWMLYITVAVVAVLALFGKLHWLAVLGAAIAGVLPVIVKKLFLLIRYFPLLSGLISRAGYGKSGNARFETAWLRLEVNPALGTLDGEVLQGEFKGRRLSALSLPELERLHAALRGCDMKSAMLLHSYIALRKRTHGARGDGAAPRDDAMTRAEALNVLGLKDGATHAEITHAHKRLIQKMHPDRGGSHYLAAKINRAKELLLKTL